MKYLVLRPKGNEMCTLQICNEGTDIKHPFESWAMRSGRQIIFIEKGMTKHLDTYYMGGGYYDTGAMYMTTFEEMVMILEEKLGPTDRQRAIDAHNAAMGDRKRHSEARRAQFVQQTETLTETVSEVGLLILKVGWMILKFIAFVVLFPFFIMWVGRNDKR